ncbi:MAG: TolC family protein [Acidobacteriia bacterium]|nr:TolC family protein [Terriglobia bacterium]
MYLARAKVFLISTIAVCSVLTPPVRAQIPAGTAQQGIITIDLKNALERARDNSQLLQSAAINVNLAREDRSQARAALLPSLSYFNQYLYTQGNGTSSGVFVANDGVHIYNSQAQVHQELFSPERMAEYRRTIAAQSLEEAKRDIVARGLVATVVQNYYAAVAAQRKSVNAQRALDEAQRFVDVTEKLEKGGEVAHADVLKAQLVLQQRQRDLQDSRLAVDKTRIALAVLLFPDYRLDFNLVDDLNSVNQLPPYDEVESLARQKSPELRAAEESIRQEEFAITIARAAYLPSLSFDYFFGINANQFATHDPEGNNRLGSVAQATLNIPVWNWWTTRSKVRQAGMRRQQAQLDLEFSRKQLISTLHSLYLEAQSAQAQVDSLRRSMEVATESLRLTNLRYEAGDVTVLEVVDAQSTLAQARNAFDDGLSRYRLALAGIQTLTGTI